MRLASLLQLLSEARSACGHAEYVVIGSLSILGMEDVADIPDGMSMSIDVDAYTRTDPGRIFDLRPTLGEDSPFHRNHGIYLDAVSPDLPTLPDGWESRMRKIERDGLIVWFLHPDDAAVSKLARLNENDVRWVRAGVAARLISPPMVRAHFAVTRFLDAEEESRARAGLEHISRSFQPL
ncbi:MAG TPA: hypothetical protein PK347_03530 [Burkholderiaceae bacterium]|nr:hypothetical protein [Burkholderiaceae bacterium]